MKVIPRCRGLRRGVSALLAAGLATAGLAVLAPAGHAIDNGDWAVAPVGENDIGGRDFFNFFLQPGQTIEDAVAISNLTNEPKTFRLYATDAYNTPVDASFALLERDEAPVDAGTWVELRATELTVEPRTTANVPFRIAVPRDATPGDHAGGIVVEDTELQEFESNETLGIGLFQRIASRVYVRVDGPLEPSLIVERIEVDDSQPLLPPFTGRGGAAIEYEVRNTGNVRITGQARLTVEGLFGRAVKRFETQDLPELLPGSSTVITEGWDGLPVIDRLGAKVRLVATDVDVTRTKTLWVIPWLWFVIAGLIFAYWYGRRWWKRRREDDADAEPPTPTPGTPHRRRVRRTELAKT